LIPTTPTDDEPAIKIDLDKELCDGEDYEIGFGFYYRFLYRLPERIELSLPRENYLGIAGISENGNYGSDAAAGDRVLTVFSEPWADNGM
jgi:hypothetical protein